MRKGKRILSLLLALVLTFNMLPLQTMATEPKSETSVNNGDLTVEGTNDFGTLLSQEIQASQEESATAMEEYEEGYSITDLTFDGAVATVEYSSLKSATLVVALYSEDGLKLLNSGKTTVLPEKNVATVTIEGDMPEYFRASTYLMDTYDMLPLCKSYETPMYTREMQELLNSTVDDYEQDQVLNLDEDKTNNFAVYDDSTILIEPTAGTNTVASIDDEKGVYVIENADEQIKNLQEGDVFAYPYGENQILIAKVGAISKDGNKVTITSDELQLEEVFSHVKIKNTGDTNDLQIDVGTVDEGLVYEGVKTKNATKQSRDYDVSVEHNTSLKYKIAYGNEKNGVEVSGSLEFGIKLNVEIYVSWSYSRVEVALAPTMTVEGKVKSSVSTDSMSLKMGQISLPFMYGAATLKFTPEFVAKLSGSIGFKAEVSGKFGFYCENGKNGLDFNLINSSSCDGFELDGEVSLFVGLQLTPEIEVLGGSVVEAKIKGKIGVEATSTPTVREFDTNAEVRHVCDGCFDGDILAVVNVDASLKILGNNLLKKLGSTELSFVDWEIKVADYYFCYSHGEFAWGNCPYYECLTTIYVKNSNGKFLQNADVYVDDQKAKTNEKGVATFYLTYGNHDITAEYQKLSAQTTVGAYKAQEVTLVVMTEGASKNIFSYVTPDDCIDDIIIFKSGKCGDDVWWNLNNQGQMIISGTGPMWNYTFESQPSWYDERDSITEVIIGYYPEDKVTTIGNYAFYDCVNLRSVEISDGVTSIGEGAFFECENLHNLLLPNTLITIGERAFDYCASLTSVKIPSSMTTIGERAFCGSGLTSVEIPSSVTTIGKSAFYQCKSLTSVEIPSSVTTIGRSAFAESGLVSVKIPSSVTIIDNLTFIHCVNLRSVEISSSVTTIGVWAFWACESLTEIVFRGNAPTFDEDAFANVEATVYYPAGNNTWTSDVYLKNYGGNITWVSYTLNRNGSIIPNDASAFTVTADVEQFSEKNELTDVGGDSIGENVPKLYAIYDGEYSSMIVDTYTLKTASFSGLVPGEQYVLLSVVSIDVEDPLKADNLLYIDQATAHEDGTLVFQYVQRTPTETSYVVACGASNKNLNDAEITFPKMIANGETQTVDPIVIYDDKTLIEGQDYIIQGTVSFTEAGTYTCYIRGVGNYTGKVECTYNVVNYVASGYSGDIEWTLSAQGVLTFSGDGEMEEYAVSEETGGYVIQRKPWENKGVVITTVVIEEGVTSVGSGAFNDLTTLTSVIFPKTTLTRIGVYAFSGCESLTSVKIPDSVISIGEAAFRFCSDLVNLELSKNVTTIGRSAFSGCSNLSSVEIPDSLTTLSFGMFGNCTSLTSMTIGNSVTTLENCVFSGCSNLTSVSFGNNVKKIGNYLFQNCECLTEITFQSNAPSIRSSTFDSVTATVYYPANNSTWTEAMRQNYGGTITWEAYTYICTDHNYEAVVTKPTCTQQGYTTYTCSACNDSYVGSYVDAKGHNSETEVTKPTCTQQGYTFHICIVCGTSYVDSYVDAIGHDYVDDVCTRCGSGSCGENLTWILNKDGVLTILGTGPMTDYYYSGNVPWNSSSSLITAVKIGDGVTSIGANAFDSCSNLTNVEIPDSVKALGEEAFYDCESLISVKIPDSVESIGGDAFFGCTSLTSVTISNSVDIIEDRVFAYCSSLTNVTIPDGVTLIGYNTFYGCTSLTSVTIPDGVTAIYGHAFKGCSSLTSVDIPDSLRCIWEGAFYGCKSLISVRIPDSVEIIGEDAFFRCSSLTGIYVDDKNSIYSSDERGVLFDKNKAMLLLAPSGISGPYRIPDSVTTIEDYAFNSCTRLTSVVIPASVTAIGSGAFRFCDNLEKITFMGDAPKVGKSIFNSVDAVAYYDADNPTWTADELQNHAGNIIWMAYAECDHEYISIVVAPTCTEIGYTAYNCTRCKDSYWEDAVPALGHTEAFVAAKTATCTEAGLTEGKHCSVCNEVLKKQETITALGHNYAETVTKPSCTSGGYTTHTCERCKHTYRDSNVGATGHTFGNWTTTKVATCAEKGTERRDCDNCNHYETREVNALVHNYKSVVTKPTCTSDGYTTHTCSTCGSSYVDSETEATGHNFGKWSVKTKPTCIETGMEIRECSQCNEKEEQVLERLGHDYEATVTSPTCTEMGYTTHTCSICNESYKNNYVASTGHNFIKYVSDGNATCIEDGTKTAKCERCDKEDTIVDKGSSTGHKEADAVVENKVEATCSLKGSYENVVYCKVCDEELSRENKEIEKLSHTEEVIPAKNATCVEKGLTEGKKCKVCDKVLKEQVEVKAKGHSYIWKISKKATSSKSGYKYGTCETCGKKSGKTTIYKISSQKLSFTKVVVNGSKQIPDVIIKDSKGNLLEEGVDYTVTPTTGGVKVGRFKMSIKYKGDYSGSKILYFTIIPKAPGSASADLSTASSTSGYDDVKVTWEKAEGATGYRVYYKKASSTKWTYATSTTKNYYTKKNLSDGYEYDFKVVSYYKTKSSSTKYYDTNQYVEASAYTLKKLSAPTITKASNGEVEVKWKEISGETGYQISQATSKSKTTALKPNLLADSTSIVISAPTGKTRYYKVRAYKEVNGKKTYGPWSTVKSYKLK